MSLKPKSARCSSAHRLIVAFSALLLTGCAELNDKLAGYSKGDAKLTVTLPAVCDVFLQPVKVPVVTSKTDARLAFTRAADALDDANDRLIVAGYCVRDERTDYAASKENPK
jgi:hypothetical protein